MIRRLLWLVAGAVLGVAGYRKAGRMAGSVRAGLRGQRAAQPPGAALQLRGFARDVGDGMAEYWDLHRAAPGRNLGGDGAGAGGSARR